ncbi:MAG TPA: RHS repeat-associated core domain-containing protein, partial [Cyclobacteriaceae bacterium]
TIGDNHLSGIDRVTNSIDFAGRLIKSLSVHTSSATSSLTILKELTYDHASRLVNTYHTINGGTRVLLASNKYNESGQLIEKNIHSTDGGTTFLQSQDYRYNIRGWLTQINNSTLSNDGVTNNDANDLFGMDIIYNQEQISVNGANSTPLYNGNISAIRWSKNILKNATDAIPQNTYSYKYDVWNRLSISSFIQKVSGASVFSGGSDENLTYDNNGNITTLQRKAIFGDGANLKVFTIDDLAYRYELKTSLGDAANTAYSNRLLNVYDNSTFYANDNPDNGFTEASRTKTNTEYLYDNNGNVTYDANKNITQILYNHLNLPTYIEFYSSGSSTRQTIEYTYDASGIKLKKVDKVGGTVISTTDYIGGLQYENGQLAFLLHDEGRAINNSGTYNYEYFLKDHQGNTRVVYGYQKEVAQYKATMEPEVRGKESQDFSNVKGTVGYNHTAKNSNSPNPANAAVLDGGNATISNACVGPAKILTIKQGDKISLEVFARYTGTVSSSRLAASVLASAVTSAFYPHVSDAPSTTAYNALNSTVLGSTVSGTASAPVAYLFYLIFSPDYTWSQFGYYPITTQASIGFEWLHLEVPINFPASVTAQQGFMYTYVANETTGSPVSFDDFQIIHEKATSALQVTQASDYYPFGLSHAYLSYSKDAPSVNLNKNKYSFQGQELQSDFGLNYYQYKFRMHDPAIGRFGAVDPLAEKYSYNSVYAFSENRVVDGIELEGAEYLSNINKFSYGNNYGLNAMNVVSNSVINTLNGGIDIWNSGVSTFQTIYNNGFNSYLNGVGNEFSNLGTGIKNTAIADYNYTINTPISKQLSDLGSDLGKAKTYESTVGLASALLLTKNFSATASFEAAAPASIAAKKGAAAADGSFYSVAYETKLGSSSYPGVTRYMHFKEANTSLDAAMKTNPLLGELGISVPRTPTGAIGGTSPVNWVWHH